MSTVIAALFGIDWASFALPAISILEKIIRPLIVYLFLIMALRIAGKREIAQLSTFDFVVLLLLSNTVQNAVIGNDNSVSGGIIGALTLLVANHAVVKFFYRHPRLEAKFEGRREFLIYRGKMNRVLMSKELITETELAEAAHKQGIGSLAEVESAEIEADGGLFFLPKRDSLEAARHREIMKRLDALGKEMDGLRAELAGKR
jgi:uncharacterized membrane protein YcaP (DUF421 family)